MPHRHRRQPSKGEFEDPLSDYSAPAYADELERVLGEEPVTAVQSTPAAVIAPDLSVAEALAQLHGLEVACLLVADEGRLVGIFTERDVLNKVAEDYQGVKDRPVRDVMTPDPVAVYETDNVATALNVVASAKLRHVPVLDVNDHILGVVSPQRITSFLRSHFESAQSG